MAKKMAHYPTTDATLSILEEPALADYGYVELARVGISKKQAMKLAAMLALGIKTLANTLHLSERTLHRYDDNTVLGKEASEKVLLLAKLYRQGSDVFGRKDKFIGWLNHPNTVFNGERPIELLDTAFGFQLIQDELVRIEHGLMA